MSGSRPTTEYGAPWLPVVGSKSPTREEPPMPDIENTAQPQTGTWTDEDGRTHTPLDEV